MTRAIPTMSSMRPIAVRALGKINYYLPLTDHEPGREIGVEAVAELGASVKLSPAYLVPYSFSVCSWVVATLAGTYAGLSFSSLLLWGTPAIKRAQTVPGPMRTFVNRLSLIFENILFLLLFYINKLYHYPEGLLKYRGCGDLDKGVLV
jgi:hypothetical protein